MGWLHLTVPGTPQQNGLAERMNRTQLERLRCIRLNAGLPKGFWGELVTTAAYLINRSPSQAMNMKTPMEVWTRVKPDSNHLRVIGSVVYAHMSQDKLDARSHKCILLGYPEGVKGYMLWKLEVGSSRILVSKDVEFQEEVLYKHVVGTNIEESMRPEQIQEKVLIEMESINVCGNLEVDGVGVNSEHEAGISDQKIEVWQRPPASGNRESGDGRCEAVTDDG
ncbi:hypothetical protein E3N88_04751 [Mikania micrantha]|uniref:Integrase catalytic domain-containing protein n=1 Tax=Mikania micrantha TaxID=192012 RepID=A0A5N6PW83_9ASTR|nr:hypothetical protein E3N88_04751 [Mikania micrantha]